LLALLLELVNAIVVIISIVDVVGVEVCVDVFFDKLRVSRDGAWGWGARVQGWWQGSGLVAEIRVLAEVRVGGRGQG
jgi:hypothetical protein